MDEFKPCPFCGAKWEPVDDEGNVELWHEDWCFIRYMSDGHRADVDNSKFWERWNMRTASSEKDFCNAIHDGRTWMVVDE